MSLKKLHLQQFTVSLPFRSCRHHPSIYLSAGKHTHTHKRDYLSVSCWSVQSEQIAECGTAVPAQVWGCCCWPALKGLWSCWPTSADISKSSLWASCLVNDDSVLTVKCSANFIHSVFSSPPFFFSRCQGVKYQLLLPWQFHCFTSKPGLFSLKNSHFVLTGYVFLPRTPDCSTDSGFIQHIWGSLHVLACLICHFLALSMTHPLTFIDFVFKACLF